MARSRNGLQISCLLLLTAGDASNPSTGCEFFFITSDVQFTYGSMGRPERGAWIEIPKPGRAQNLGFRWIKISQYSSAHGNRGFYVTLDP